MNEMSNQNIENNIYSAHFSCYVWYHHICRSQFYTAVPVLGMIYAWNLGEEMTTHFKTQTSRLITIYLSGTLQWSPNVYGVYYYIVIFYTTHAKLYGVYVTTLSVSRCHVKTCVFWSESCSKTNVDHVTKCHKTINFSRSSLRHRLVVIGATRRTKS